MIFRRLLALMLLIGLTVPALAMPLPTVAVAGPMAMSDDGMRPAPCHKPQSGKSSQHDQAPAKCHDCIGCAAPHIPAALANPAPLPRLARALSGRAEPLLALTFSPEPPPPRY